MAYGEAQEGWRIVFFMLPENSSDIEPFKLRVHAARASLSAMQPGLRGMTKKSHEYANSIDELLRVALPLETPCSWIAVGSYGRKTAGPCSDIDLRLLCPRHDDEIAERAALALRGVLDKSLVGGCQTVTPAEWLKAAHTDLAAATALLDARLLDHDDGLLAPLIAESRATLFAPARCTLFAQRLGEECTQRAARFGATVYLIEPDLRASPGGLRDLDILSWAACARFACPAEYAFAELLDARILSRGGHAQLERAARFLRSLRCALHARAGRRSDRLSFDAQEDVATKGRPGDVTAVEQLMQQYYLHARVVLRVREQVLDACSDTGEGSAISSATSDSRLVVTGGKIALASPGTLYRDPMVAFASFEVATQHGLSLHGRLRDALLSASSEVQWAQSLRSAPGAGDRLLALLAEGALMGDLDETGILFAMVPEFEPVRGRAHHDIYHVYTVDVHSVAAVRMLAGLPRGEQGTGFELAARLAQEGYNKRVLPLAVLLHDLGKGYPDKDGSRRNHAAVGARMVPAIAARLGLSPEETARVVLLVDQHLAFYKLATRADLDSPETLATLFEVVPNREALVQLYLLTVVDLETTSPGALNGWKLHVLDTLFQRAEQTLRGDVHESLVPICDAHQALLDGTPDGSVGFGVTNRDGGGEYVQVAVVVPDARGALARVAGAFACSDMEILGARLNVAPNEDRAIPRALDLFWCKRRGHKGASPLQLRKLEKAVLNCMQERDLPPVAPPPSWQRRGPAILAEVRTRLEAGGRCCVEVMAEDTPGLLHRLALGFYDLGLDIQLAKINTEGAKAIDVFYVFGSSGTPIEKEQLAAIRTRLMIAIG